MIHVDLTTKIGDFLELTNPYWISSAHYSHKESVIEAWKEFSPAALTLKSSDIDPKSEDKRSVREKTEKILPRYGRSFYCDGPKQEELLTYERTAELLKFANEKLPKTKVGISVLSSAAQDYAKLRGMCDRADFSELNLKYSFRIKDKPEHLKESANTFEAILKEIERFLEAFAGVPAFIKLRES